MHLTRSQPFLPVRFVANSWICDDQVWSDCVSQLLHRRARSHHVCPIYLSGPMHNQDANPSGTLENTWDSNASNRCTACFDSSPFPILIHQDALHHAHHEVLDQLFSHRDFPTFANFPIWAPITKYRTNCLSFSSSGASVLDLLLVSHFLRLLLISATVVIGKSVLPELVPPSPRLFLAARRCRFPSHFDWW